jgi:glycine/D-amino acid oxidase-like deaminating enzyme
VQGLWIAAGHEGLGITTALATAELIVAGITGGRAPVDPTPYLPARAAAAAAASTPALHAA